jgi:hypothetical protein
MTSQPWSWIPDKHAWYSNASAAMRAWQPHPDLDLDKALLTACLEGAAAERSGWLLHPCATALTAPDTGDQLQRDLQLAVWIASNCPDSSIKVVIPSNQWVWTAGGGREIQAGAHDLQVLGVPADNTVSHGPLLDVWCLSLGVVLRHTWAEFQKLSGQDEQRLESEIVSYMKATHWLGVYASPICEWIDSVTKVAIPFYSESGGDGIFRSLSEPGFPGMIQLDLFGGHIQILEALVHESAHRHLYIEEATSPLINPDWQGRYRSPLRPDARPLRGILMAYHALAYICCLYRTLADNLASHREQVMRELPGLLDGMRDAERTLLENRRHLTKSGNVFLDQTLQVAAYASS